MLTDSELVTFLQRTLPRLRLRWPGFRRVRGQVKKRLARRIETLGLGDVTAYERHLAAHPDEWTVLETLCRITITRFYRDREVFETLGREILPELAGRAGHAGTVRAWSAGCASGEEPYSLALLWRLAVAPRFPGVALEVLATDADQTLLTRARRAIYPRGTLRELPAPWIEASFEAVGTSALGLRPDFRAGVHFEPQDLAGDLPAGCFDLILCRNLAFTYFDETRQRETLDRLASRLDRGGFLVIGIHERLPEPSALQAWPGARCIHRLAG